MIHPLSSVLSCLSKLYSVLILCHDKQSCILPSFLSKLSFVLITNYVCLVSVTQQLPPSTSSPDQLSILGNHEPSTLRNQCHACTLILPHQATSIQSESFITTTRSINPALHSILRNYSVKRYLKENTIFELKS